MKPRLTVIAAIDQHRLLANEKGIPWKLPRDATHFRQYTSNKWLVLGRKTYREMRGWFKEHHTPLILTSDRTLEPVRGRTVSTLSEALTLAEEGQADELVCCGGAQVYAETLPMADELVLTLIHHAFPPGERPVYFPAWNPEQWQEVAREFHAADETNPHDMEFVTLVAKKPANAGRENLQSAQV